MVCSFGTGGLTHQGRYAPSVRGGEAFSLLSPKGEGGNPEGEGTPKGGTPKGDKGTKICCVMIFPYNQLSYINTTSCQGKHKRKKLNPANNQKNIFFKKATQKHKETQRQRTVISVKGQKYAVL